jgi:multifunctional 2-oxoglutarate metabolism enzyme
MFTESLTAYRVINNDEKLGRKARRSTLGSVTSILPDDPTLGPNSWLVDEMRDQFNENPSLVSESWRAYFHGQTGGPVVTPAGYTSNGSTNGSNGSNGSVSAEYVAAVVPAPSTPAVPPAVSPAVPPAAATVSPASTVRATPPVPAGGEQSPLRGVASKIVQNMEASLDVPTATSVRDIPTKLLEVQRNIINNHLKRTRGGKVSFTHLIAYAIVKGLNEVPAMRNTFTRDAAGNPMLVRNEAVGLGIAVDLAKADGTRALVVPCIKGANHMTFREFYDAYETLIRKARTNKLGVDDFAGVTVSITNPGGIGTRHSVPRLMPGQAAIIGLGAIDYPAAFMAADPAKLAELGISKTVTVTSTYDHRIIQGAESGNFLDKLQHLLTDNEAFWDDVFDSMEIPYEPARWHIDNNPADTVRAAVVKASAAQELINAYRSRGHLIADLDPLDIMQREMPDELDPISYELSIWDLDRDIYTGDIAGKDHHTVGQLLSILRDAYCRTVGVEYMHIMDPAEKTWLQSRLEGVDQSLSTNEQRRVLDRLNNAEAFEKFLAKRYPGTKRFGLEGGESAMVILDAALDAAAETGVQGAVIGMPHRGRLNTLVNVVGKPVAQVFKEFEDVIEGTVYGSGDVKYHLGATGTYTGLSGRNVDITLAPNPSHLEAVYPVVEGMVRAQLDLLDEPGGTRILPIIMHGDGAFIGQGVVQETLNLSQLAGYKTGGTIHLIVNNQVGFTTNPDAARSSVYCTDVAKMVQAPIFHVNGDDPEACYRVGRLAANYRQEFKKDVVIDMVCYRRMGHNEGDEPRYTQPLMYERIDNHLSTREIYADNLVGRKDITQEEADEAFSSYQNIMQTALDETRTLTSTGSMLAPNLDDFGSPFDPILTGVDKSQLDIVATATHSWPEGFNIHPKLAKQLEARKSTYESSGEVDWALAEAMAFGSMALEGYTVRISGEDCRRGTFSHRQAVFIDTHTGAEWYPLANLSPDQGRFNVYDSSLSEYAVLGFDYGYAIQDSEAFVVWEAQFGDFANGAQIIVDQFIASGETKWGQLSGLTMLLPHGYEGQGPEHSSARLERFLQLCAQENMRVVNVTTAAQLFHLLRRQVHSPNRKPLIVMAPKSGLRSKETRSNVSELTSGSFQEVLDDNTITDPAAVKKVVVSFGKVAWDADKARQKAGVADRIALVKVEQIYPWPESQVEAILAKYPNAEDVVWLQEEPANFGGWNFVEGRLHAICGRLGRKLGMIARPKSGSPATGSHHEHDHELEELQAAVVSGV